MAMSDVGWLGQQDVRGTGTDGGWEGTTRGGGVISGDAAVIVGINDTCKICLEELGENAVSIGWYCMVLPVVCFWTARLTEYYRLRLVTSTASIGFPAGPIHTPPIWKCLPTATFLTCIQLYKCRS